MGAFATMSTSSVTAAEALAVLRDPANFSKGVWKCTMTEGDTYGNRDGTKIGPHTAGDILVAVKYSVRSSDFQRFGVVSDVYNVNQGKSMLILTKYIQKQ